MNPGTYAKALDVRSEWVFGRGMNLDGPHRVFAVVAGLWALRALVLVSRYERCEEMRGWDPLPLSGLCSWHRHEAWSLLAFIAIPIACLYLVAFIIGPPVSRWIRAGFSSRELG